MRTLLIDNYDSFTYNLYHLIAEVMGEPPVVVRNDADVDAVRLLEVDNVVVSPGPGKPYVERDFGISKAAICDFGLPLLGVCLGHQGIGHFHGACVVPCDQVMHGRLSRVRLADEPLFRGMPESIDVVRYHSLVVRAPLPPCLRAIAWLENGTIMGLRHVGKPLYGVQFHPESILTEHGHTLVANFCALSRQHGAASRVAERTTA